MALGFRGVLAGLVFDSADTKELVDVGGFSLIRELSTSGGRRVIVGPPGGGAPINHGPGGRRGRFERFRPEGVGPLRTHNRREATSQSTDAPGAAKRPAAP